MTARTIVNPANNSSVNSSVIRNELQTLENEIVAGFINSTFTGNPTLTGGILTIGGDGTNTGAIQLKPANPNYNWYSWVNKEVGASEGIALQAGVYPTAVVTPLTISRAGVMATPAGTVSQLGYEQYMLSPGSSSVPMTASTTYYFGNFINQFFPGSSATANRVYAHRSGTIKKIGISFRTGSGTPSSSHTISLYVRVDNTTDYTIGTDFSTSSANTVVFAEYITNIPFNFGSYLNIKIVTPAWTTVANYPYIDIRLYIE